MFLTWEGNIQDVTLFILRAQFVNCVGLTLMPSLNLSLSSFSSNNKFRFILQSIVQPFDFRQARRF